MHFMPKSYWNNPHNTDGIENIKMAFHLVPKLMEVVWFVKVDEYMDCMWYICMNDFCKIVWICRNASDCWNFSLRWR